MFNFTRKPVILSAVILTVALLNGCRQEAPKTMAKQPPVEVDVVTLKTQPVKLETELPGRTTAYRVAEVRPQVNGIVKKRLFTEGSKIVAGDVLYQIDPALYQTRLDSARATLAKAKANEHSAQLKATRYKILIKKNAVSEMDQVEIEANWKEAVAEVASAEAAVNSARIDLEYTRITAPISGRIGKSMISEGALVTAQQSAPLATIQQLDPLYVDVTQSSTDLLRLKKNLSTELLQKSASPRSDVTLLLEDGAKYAHTGSLEFSDVTVDQTTGTVTLRAIVANPDEELLPGMFVRARLTTGVKQNAILVPAESISRNKKGQAVVMLVNDQSTVESRLIDSGQNMGDKVLVIEGLSAGDRLITAGFQKIKAGAQVTTVEKQGVLAKHVAPNTEVSALVKKAE